MEKLTGKELQKSLTYSVEHIAKVDATMTEKSFEFCENYKDFLSASKTERLAAANILEIAKANGFIVVEDTAAIAEVVDALFAERADLIEDYKNGKTNVFGFFMGQANRALKGKATPMSVKAYIEKKCEF